MSTSIASGVETLQQQHIDYTAAEEEDRLQSAEEENTAVQAGEEGTVRSDEL